MAESMSITGRTLPRVTAVGYVQKYMNNIGVSLDCPEAEMQE